MMATSLPNLVTRIASLLSGNGGAEYAKRALAEAYQSGCKIDPAITEQIASSLAKYAPRVGSLRNSPGVAAIEALNATPLRRIVSQLRRAHHRFWMRAQ